MNQKLQMVCPSCLSDLQVPLHVPQFWCIHCGMGYKVIVNGGIIYLDPLKKDPTHPQPTSPRPQPLPPPNVINYWWITANPERWQWTTIFNNPSRTQYFRRGNIPSHFEEAKPRDLIFGYQASPYRQVLALAFVREGLQLWNNKEVILIERIGDELFQYPIPWKVIKLEIPNSEPIKSNAQGTLFRLRNDEAKKLARLIIDAGNKISLPEMVSSAGGLFSYNNTTTHESSGH